MGENPYLAGGRPYPQRKNGNFLSSENKEIDLHTLFDVGYGQPDRLVTDGGSALGWGAPGGTARLGERGSRWVATQGNGGEGAALGAGQARVAGSGGGRPPFLGGS